MQYALTRDHLSADRNYDCHSARAAKLSSYNEAERVNGAETSAVTKAEVPSLLKLGPPRNSSELQRNRRAFQMAITNAIGDGRYSPTSDNPYWEAYCLPILRSCSICHSHYLTGWRWQWWQVRRSPHHLQGRHP